MGPWLPEPVINAGNYESISLAFLVLRERLTPAERIYACGGSGDLDGLVKLLADDVVFWTDGGGKVRGAALQRVHGPKAVALFIIGVTARFNRPGNQAAVVNINRKPTLLVRNSDGTPVVMISIDVDEGASVMLGLASSLPVPRRERVEAGPAD